MNLLLLWNHAGAGSNARLKCGLPTFVREQLQSCLNIFARFGIFLTRFANMGNRSANTIFHWLHGHAFERLFVRAVFQNFGEHIEPLQVNKLLRDEGVAKLFLQCLGVRVADAE